MDMKPLTDSDYGHLSEDKLFGYSTDGQFLDESGNDRITAPPPIMRPDTTVPPVLRPGTTDVAGFTRYPSKDAMQYQFFDVKGVPSEEGGSSPYGN